MSAASHNILLYKMYLLVVNISFAVADYAERNALVLCLCGEILRAKLELVPDEEDRE